MFYTKFKKSCALVIDKQESPTLPTILWLTGTHTNGQLPGFSFCAKAYSDWLEELSKFSGLTAYFDLKNIKLRRLTRSVQQSAILNLLPAQKMMSKLGKSSGLFIIGLNINTDSIVLLELDQIPIVPTLERLAELNQNM